MATSNTSPFKALGTDTHGAYSLLEIVTAPGGGPPPHSHAKEDEGFFVLEGTFRFWIGDNEPVTVGPGVHVFGPRTIVHRFQNVCEAPGRMLLIFAPAGCEQYFIELAAARERLADPELLATEKAIDQKFGISINRRR